MVMEDQAAVTRARQPAVGRAIDRAVGSRVHEPILLNIRRRKLTLERSVDRDELVAFACSLVPRLRERTVNGSSLGTDALYEIPLMRPKGGTRKGETDAPD
jgi:hypothetical protein